MGSLQWGIVWRPSAGVSETARSPNTMRIKSERAQVLQWVE
jgi:hypothetical protein